MKSLNLSKKTKIIISVLIFVCVAVLIATVSIVAGNAKRTSYLSPELAKLYKDASFSELIDKVNECDSVENVDLEVYAALADKLADVDSDVISDLIEDNKNNPVLQSLYINVAESDGIEIPQNVLESLLFDQKIDPDVRLEALFYCGKKGTKYEEQIEKLVSDEEMAFYAIRELYSIDKQRGAALAEQIISQYDGKRSEKLDGALDVKLFTLEESSTLEERRNFVALCDKLAREAYSIDETNRMVVLSRMSYLDCWESMEYLMNDETYNAKSLIARHQEETITGILKNEPDKEKLDVALRTLIEGPESNYLEPMKENMEKYASFYAENPELAAKAEQALALIEEEKKYEDDAKRYYASITEAQPQ